MILFFYKPYLYYQNRPQYYSYQEDKLDKTKPCLPDEEMVGWYFEYQERIFSPIKKLVLFEKQQLLFIDFGQGVFNLSTKEITFNKTDNISFFHVTFFKNQHEIYSIHIKKYWWQHFMHDGNFSEDICPLIDVFDRINEDIEGLIRFFHDKKWKSV